MKFTAVVDSDNMTDIHCAMPSVLEKINQGYFSTTNLDNVSSVHGAIHLRLSRDVCSIEGTARRSLKIIKTTRQFSQKMKGSVYYNECHMAENVPVPTTFVSQVTAVEKFDTL